MCFVSHGKSAAVSFFSIIWRLYVLAPLLLLAPFNARVFVDIRVKINVSNGRHTVGDEEEIENVYRHLSCYLSCV